MTQQQLFPEFLKKLEVCSRLNWVTLSLSTILEPLPKISAWFFDVFVLHTGQDQPTMAQCAPWFGYTSKPPNDF